MTEEADCFKISLWHVRCVQYIISAVTSWIAHFMLWMCQYYEVLSSDLMGSVSVDKLWPMPAHTHTHTHRDSACVTLPIPGHCLNKMLYPCAICSMLYLWQEMYLITFFLAIRPRLTRALRLRWQERFASMCREQRRRSYSVRSRPGGENAPRPSPAYPSSSSVFRATRKCNEPSWNAGRIWGAKIRNLCVQMPKHTRDIRCALKEGPVCLISTPPTWKNGC